MAGTPGPMMSPQPGGDMRGPGQDSLGPYGGMGLNGDFPSSMGGQVCSIALLKSCLFTTFSFS